MTDTKTRATGSPVRPHEVPRDLQRSRELDVDAKPVDLLRAPEGELRRFAQVKAPASKRSRPGLRPKFTREW